MMIIISGHNFVHAMTAELSWHVQKCDLMESLDLEQKKRFQSWAQMPFVIYVLGPGGECPYSQPLSFMTVPVSVEWYGTADLHVTIISATPALTHILIFNNMQP